MNKEQQIEEMANYYCEYCKKQTGEKFCEHIDDKSCNIFFEAELFYNAGYRKIPEDSVVLSREELAQKIYDDIFAILKIKLWLYGDDIMTKNLNGLTKQKILDFTTKWGIKDNHLNEKDYSHINHLQEHDKQIKEQSSKETAKEIIQLLSPECEQCDENWHTGCLCLRATIAEKIAKQYGVEADND